MAIEMHGNKRRSEKKTPDLRNDRASGYACHPDSR